MDDTSGPVFSHFGICVSDLERSLRFYCDALGFEKAESHVIGSEFARLMEFPDVEVTSQFIRRGPTAIELLAFREPAPFGPRERRAVNQLGLTHLSFRVRDVAGTAARMVELGVTMTQDYAWLYKGTPTSNFEHKRETMQRFAERWITPAH